MRAAFLAACLSAPLAACTGGPTPMKMAGPADYLMTPPHPFPNVGPGSDMGVIVTEAAAAHNHNARKIKGLQRYIRTVRKG
jgi:hypothetical protein